VTTRPTLKNPSLALSISVLLVAMFNVYAGAALAKQMFPLVGASGTYRIAPCHQRIDIAGRVESLAAKTAAASSQCPSRNSACPHS
jgi:threonine/homoserine efflux transporter RhtA